VWLELQHEILSTSLLDLGSSASPVDSIIYTSRMATAQQGYSGIESPYKVRRRSPPRLRNINVSAIRKLGSIADKSPYHSSTEVLPNFHSYARCEAYSLTTLLCFSFWTFLYRCFLARLAVNDSLWKFIGSRFTVPVLEGFVRNLSCHQKLGELAPLSFALKRHYAP
jgi:hypothetical protein